MYFCCFSGITPWHELSYCSGLHMEETWRPYPQLQSGAGQVMDDNLKVILHMRCLLIIIFCLVCIFYSSVSVSLNFVVMVVTFMIKGGNLEMELEPIHRGYLLTFLWVGNIDLLISTGHVWLGFLICWLQGLKWVFCGSKTVFQSMLLMWNNC